ncbi:Suppressor of Sensor Kinase (SLN1) [Phlyctochytrium planicorne]|nr:Suppressor of Sensor Kinase (SLN1) [Phlyctochytrium planicorne]
MQSGRPSPPFAVGGVRSNPSPPIGAGAGGAAVPGGGHYFHYGHYTGQGQPGQQLQHSLPIQTTSNANTSSQILELRQHAQQQQSNFLANKRFPPPMPIPTRKTSLLDLTPTRTSSEPYEGSSLRQVDTQNDEDPPPEFRRSGGGGKRRLSFMSLAQQPLRRPISVTRSIQRSILGSSVILATDEAGIPREEDEEQQQESQNEKDEEEPDRGRRTSRQPLSRAPTITKTPPGLPVYTEKLKDIRAPPKMPLPSLPVETNDSDAGTSSDGSRPTSLMESIRSTNNDSLGRTKSRKRRILIPSVASFASLLSPVDVDPLGLPAPFGGDEKKEEVQSEALDDVMPEGITARKVRARRRSMLIDEHIAALGKFIHEIYTDFSANGAVPTAIPEAATDSAEAEKAQKATITEEEEEEDEEDVEEKEAEVDYLSSLFPNWAMGKLLGTGANGMVYEAVHPESLQPLFAIKKIKIVNTHPWLPMPKLFSTIVKILRLVDHPNILRFYGVESLEGDMYIFMEYAGGKSIHDVIYDDVPREGMEGESVPKSIPGIHDDFQCLFWVKQILEGVRFLHSHDIIHRDLKPGNLLLKNNMIKICDFGGAKIQQKCCPNPHLTQIFGSPSYMAPEIVTSSPELGEKGAQDVWSLGCCFYEMVLGKPPWHQLDNVFALYFHMGTWAKKAEEMHPLDRDWKPSDNANNETIPFRRLFCCNRHGKLYESEERILRTKSKEELVSGFWQKHEEDETDQKAPPVPIKTDSLTENTSKAANAENEEIDDLPTPRNNGRNSEADLIDDYINFSSNYSTLNRSEGGDDNQENPLSATDTLRSGSVRRKLLREDTKRKRPSLAIFQPLPHHLSNTSKPEFLENNLKSPLSPLGRMGEKGRTSKLYETVNHTREEILESAGSDKCLLMPSDCLLYSMVVNNPLMMTALESGKFSYDALDFLHLCLRWNPKYRPTVFQLLRHPFVSEVDYVVP